MQKAELIAKMKQGYADFTAYLRTLAPWQLTIPTDAAGWTIKDHVMHSVAWEDTIDALLTRQSRAERMGVDEAVWANRDIDAINAAIQRRTKSLPFAEVMRRFDEVHQRVLATLEPLADVDINAPLIAYLPAASESYKNDPIYLYIAGNSYEHYEEHRPWLEAISAEAGADKRERLIQHMGKAWDYLSGYLASLSEEDATQPTDPAGWTPKDHVIHLAVWEGGVAALLDKQDRLAAMGINAALWAAHDIDGINTVIYQNNRDLSWTEVKRRLEEAHGRLLRKVESLSLADLEKPYGNYLPAGQEDDTGDQIYNRICGNTFGHYPEHIEWIDAILRGE